MASEERTVGVPAQEKDDTGFFRVLDHKSRAKETAAFTFAET